MTAEEANAIRKKAELTQAELATVLRLSGDNGKQYVRKMETGKVPVSGPVSIVLEMLDRGLLPAELLPQPKAETAETAASPEATSPSKGSETA